MQAGRQIVYGGVLVDGTGAPARRADLVIEGDRVAAVLDGGFESNQLESLDAALHDATGKVVTPGFVDVHTHYDGQATWDSALEPSSSHGVTTVVMGNCGVGFAPVRPGAQEWLIQVMEGVEDIPGTALSEGIKWSWQSFPEYLDALDGLRWSVDVGAQIPHGALRAFVMGDAGADEIPASPDDCAAMRDAVREAVEAGAFGVTTSRTRGHLARDGRPVPGTFAQQAELAALFEGLGGKGIFEVAQDGVTMVDRGSTTDELSWMAEYSRQFNTKVSYICLQTDQDPDGWRRALERTSELNDQGADLMAQVAARPFGMLLGAQGNNAFGLRPSYRALNQLEWSDKIGALQNPATRTAILTEADGAPPSSYPFDSLPVFLQMMLHRTFVLDDELDYEPDITKTVAFIAQQRGQTALETFYDLMLQNDGRQLFLLPLFNYANTTHDDIFEMLTHPYSVSSLSDAGAHCNMICDGSIPTYLLSHWARDRRGSKLSLEAAVKMQTNDTAVAFGLGDRGVLSAGRRADLNVIDFQSLALTYPIMTADLPAGGSRLLQGSIGYDLTMVAGKVTRRLGVPTGELPGRLLRAG